MSELYHHWGQEGLADVSSEKREDRTFVQRRFASTNEQERGVEQLHEQGIDPIGKEKAGHFHAEFYLSRPKQEVAKAPIERLLAA
jgi:hypothetical protein